jgi:hypothetical protein
LVVSELDFQFLVMQPISGFHHFKEGISKLKQVTGRVHHNVQHYNVGIIAGTALSEFVATIRVLMDF